jgi:L-glyceraldehyde 3-phosphate reductase
MEYSAHPSRYQQMKYRRCGKSGIWLPEISLGLWHNFGHVDRFDISRKLLLRAFDLGITHFDLANNYGPPPGTAEENFGRIMQNDFRPYRDEMNISTKAGYLMWPGPYGEWGSKKYLVSSLDQSLKRMKLDYVDIFYHHRPDPETPLEETMAALDLIVKQGKALYIGISNYPADNTHRAAAILKQMGTPCLIHQPSYSMFNRWVEESLLEVLDEDGIGCIAFSPLAQGLLTDRYLNSIPADSRVAKQTGFLSEDRVMLMLPQIKLLNEIAAQRGQSLAQMAIAWLLKDKRVTSVLVGASSVAQLENNLGAMDNTRFNETELTAIESVLKK